MSDDSNFIGDEWQKPKFDPIPKKSPEERQGIMIGLGAMALLFLIVLVSLLWRLA